MAAFLHRTTLWPGDPVGIAPNYLSYLTDFETVEINGQIFLYAASRATGGLTVLSLGEGAAMTFLEERAAAFDRGTDGVVDIDAFQIGTVRYLAPSGITDDKIALHRLDADGGLGAVTQVGSDPSAPHQMALSEIVRMGNQTFLFAAEQGANGVKSFGVAGNGVMDLRHEIADSETGHLSGITASSQATIGNKTFVFFSSGDEHGVSSYRVTPKGNLVEVDSADPTNGLWVSAPTAMTTALAGGNTYIVVGAAGSDSLSVLKVAGWGGLTPVDHVLDDLTTRFRDVSAIDHVKTNHRNLVVAGGSDDGLSLFELTPSGKLLHMASIADEAGATLQNVSSLKTVMLGDEMQVFAGSETEPGISQFSVDLGKFGVLRRGSTEGEFLNAIWADDLLEGFEGDDVLKGNNGADILIDGDGVDKMFGGKGADTFVFEPDRDLDIVKDFRDGQDKLDLSKYELLYDISQLELIQKPFGVFIRYDGEGFRIEAETGTLQVADLTGDDFIF